MTTLEQSPVGRMTTLAQQTMCGRMTTLRQHQCGQATTLTQPLFGQVTPVMQQTLNPTEATVMQTSMEVDGRGSDPTISEGFVNLISPGAYCLRPLLQCRTFKWKTKFESDFSRCSVTR